MKRTHSAQPAASATTGTIRVVRAFDETLSPTPGNTLSPVHISAFKAFQKRVKKQIGFDFDARHEANTPAQLAEVQEMFEHIYSDIQNGADWVSTFKAEFSDKARQDRKALEQAWAEARKEMFTALSEYPRDVSEVAFSNRFDERFGHPSGRTREFIEPTPAITDDTLQADIRHFKAATADIHADTEWMQAMPAVKPLSAYSRSRCRRVSRNSLSRLKVAVKTPGSLNLM